METETVTSTTSVEAKTNGVEAMDTTSPVKSVETKSPAKPVETKSPAKPVEKSPAKPVETKSTAKPVETKSPAKPVDTKSPAKPVETKSPAKPVDNKSPAKPVESKSPVKPTNGTVESKSPEKEKVEDIPQDEPFEEEEDKKTLRERLTGGEALEAYVAGKRELAIRDYDAAIESLSKACSLLSEELGDEMADEMGDVYYAYGKALLENVRTEQNVLGDKLENKEDEDIDEEDEDGDEEEEKEDGAEEAEPKENGTSEAEKKETDGEQKETEPVENGEAKQNGDAKAEAEQNGDAKADTEENGDIKAENGDGDNDETQQIADDLELSWQFLEMAKVIYGRRARKNRTVAMKLAETYLTLCENALESERYDVAVADVMTCLTIQRRAMTPVSRCIAEALYQLGVAHSMADNFDDAVKSLKESVEVLENRTKELLKAQAAGEKTLPKEFRDSFYTIEGEVKEIEDVVKDIKLKITDVEDHKEMVKAKLAEQIGFGDPSAPSSSSGSSAALPSNLSYAVKKTPTIRTTNPNPVDISHLIRKKKRESDGEVAEGNAEKKPRTEVEAEN